MSLGPDARSLIAAADGADDPSSADEARIRARLAARLAVAAGTGIAAGTAAKTAAASTGTAATTTLAAKIAIGVAVVSATTAGGTALYERTMHERAPTVIEAPVAATAPTTTITTAPARTAATAAPVNVNVSVNAPAPAAPTVKPIAKPTSSPAAIVATDTITEEAALLRAAHASLASGDGASAMRALDEHARRYPRGALAEEREAARVLALCAQGRASEARASASAFVSANPRSPYAAQVRRSCATKDQ